ncbi:MAG: hypothetical protein AAB336_09415 [Acidobacteriota bacterium]
MSFLLNTTSIITCPHGGKILCKPFFGGSYLIDGQPVCVKEDNYSIYGCPMPKNQCHSVKWQNDPFGVLIFGRYQVLTNDSVGVCLDHKNSVTGNAVSVVYQTKVSLEYFRDSFKSK